MATKKEVKKAVVEETAVQTVPGSALPAWIERGVKETGAEHIQPEDVRMPRLLIAQGLSPQVLKNDPAFIPGLSIGDAFNDLTGEIYGDGPMTVIVVRADPPRWVEYDPEDRKNILDRNVPHGDPRTQWTVNEETGEREKPRAMQFYDYVVMIEHGPDDAQAPNTLEPVAFSYKSTGINHAKRLNAYLRLRPGVPIYAFRYELKPVQMKNDQGTWFLFAVHPAGIVTEDQYKAAKEMFQQIKLKDIAFDRGVVDAADPDAPDAEKEM
jgi:hypothetical protein